MRQPLLPVLGISLLLLSGSPALAGDPLVTCGPGTVNAGEPAPFFSDDMESGSGDFIVSSPTGNGDWAILVTPDASSPPQAWVSTSVDEVKDDYLDTMPIQVPNRGAYLAFQHVVDLEFGRDGAVLEISVDGGAFVDLCREIESGGYTATIALDTSSPVAEHRSWSGQIGTAGATEEVVVDLDPFAGSEVVIRFRLACDEANGGGSWTVDDLLLVESGGGVVAPILFVSQVDPVIGEDFEAAPTTPGPFFSDDLQCGNSFDNWIHYALPASQRADDWGIGDGWFSSDFPAAGLIKDHALELRPLSVPVEGAHFSVLHYPNLSWEHGFPVEECYSAGILEGSTDDGATFFDMGPHIFEGGYNMQVVPNFGNPLAGRSAWAGPFIPDRWRSLVDLTPFAGQDLILRFRMATSDRPGIGSSGWRIFEVAMIPILPPPGDPLPLTERFTKTRPGGFSEWAIVEEAEATSGTRTAFCPAGGGRDEYLDLEEFLVLPESSFLTFRHRWHIIESSWDGAVLEASVDGGPFQDLSPFFAGARPYNKTIRVDSGTPLAGRDCWGGNSGTGMSVGSVNLGSFLGSTIKIRWYLSAGGFIDSEGWWIDDVRIGGFDGTGGNDRTVDLVRNVHPLRVELEAPPLGPQRPPYVLYGWAGAPDETTPTVQPFGIGTLCFGNPVGGGIQPILIFNTAGSEPLVGASTIPQGQVPDAPGVLISRGAGQYPAGTFTLQAIVRDRASAGELPGSISNVVIVRSN